MTQPIPIKMHTSRWVRRRRRLVANLILIAAAAILVTLLILSLSKDAGWPA